MIITWITAVNWLFLFILVKMMLSSLIGKNDTSYSCLSFVHFSCLANTLVISSSIVNRLVVQLFRPFLFLHTYKSVQWFLCVNINAKTKYLLFFNLIFFHWATYVGAFSITVYIGLSSLTFIVLCVTKYTTFYLTISQKWALGCFQSFPHGVSVAVYILIYVVLCTLMAFQVYILN